MKTTLRKVLSLTLALVLVLALAACGGAASTSQADKSAAPAESGATAESKTDGGATTDGKDLKVGMLLPGTINDHGWNAEAHRGLMLIKEELGAEVHFTERVAASDYEEVFRGYAEMGCQIVYGHGYEFGEAAMAVAAEFPDTFFIVTSADFEKAPNVASLQNLNNEQGFLAGVVAALESKSGVVGVIGGMQIPSITLFVEGFKDGAKHINPDIKVLTAYTGDFDDVAKVKEQALAFVKEGADVLTHDADQAGLGMFEAVNESEGILAVGAVGDQYEQAPGKVITSATNMLSKAILLSAEYYIENTLEPKVYNFGVAEGVVELADFRDYPISDENKATIEETAEKIASGDIKVDYRPTGE